MSETAPMSISNQEVAARLAAISEITERTCTGLHSTGAADVNGKHLYEVFAGQQDDRPIRTVETSISGRPTTQAYHHGYMDDYVAHRFVEQQAAELAKMEWFRAEKRNKA